MPALVSSFAGLAVMLFVLALFRNHGDPSIARRLGRMAEPASDVGNLSPSFVARMLRPAGRKLLSVARSALPTRVPVAVERRLEIAGNPVSIGRFFGYWSLSAVVVPTILTLILLGTGGGLTVRSGFAVLLWIGLGTYIPWRWLTRRADACHRAITRALPDAIDLLITNIEAGLGLQSAMLVVADKASGPIAGEFARVVREVSIGRSRGDALLDMAARSGAPDVRLFARAMLQAEQTGIPIARVLRNHSKEMRERRRQRARDQAAKIPVKIVMATVFFMFPTLFMLMMGPVVLNVMEYFGKG